MDPKNLATIHQSLIKPQLLSGCDRELFLSLCMLTTLIVGPYGIIAANWGLAGAGIIAFFVARHGLAKMAKVDPLMRSVYSRSASQKEFYPARSLVTDPDRTEFQRWR